MRKRIGIAASTISGSPPDRLAACCGREAGPGSGPYESAVVRASMHVVQANAQVVQANAQAVQANAQVV